MYIVEFKDNFNNIITNCIMQSYRVTVTFFFFFSLSSGLPKDLHPSQKVKREKIFLEDLQIFLTAEVGNC